MEDEETVKDIQKMLNTKISDCNKCPYLNITEEQQNKEYQKTKNKKKHICNKYGKRVFHMCAISIRKEHSKLFPLAECETTEIEGFLKRRNNE